MLQFLAWIADRPRPRAEVLDAWRSTCPRLSIFEDATIEGFVCIENRQVIITPRGRALLNTGDVTTIGRDRVDALAGSLASR